MHELGGRVQLISHYNKLSSWDWAHKCCSCLRLLPMHFILMHLSNSINLISCWCKKVARPPLLTTNLSRGKKKTVAKKEHANTQLPRQPINQSGQEFYWSYSLRNVVFKVWDFTQIITFLLLAQTHSFWTRIFLKLWKVTIKRDNIHTVY